MYGNDIAETIRQKFKVKSLEAQKKLSTLHPHAVAFLKEKGVPVSQLRNHSTKLLGAGIAGGVLLLSPSIDHTITSVDYAKRLTTNLNQTATNLPARGYERTYMEKLNEVLPQEVRALNREEEKRLEQLFYEAYGVKARGTLEGEHLNTTYGRIGAEQHLRRYPGDTMATHDAVAEKDEGMAPGLGAWGYFAPSKEKLTPELVETEKWYAVVQTLYLPDWNTRTRFLRDWYKHRKVLIVNTDNGKAVVAGIADSGPAAWTGKHFGGSPEVMNHLGGARYKKGPVVLFFVDDPNNKVPLGPVTMQQTQLPDVSLKAL